MERQFEQIQAQPNEPWNGFSYGRKKRNDLFMDFLRPMGNEIIYLLNPKDTDVILDVAAGAREPGLTIASKWRGGKDITTEPEENKPGITRDDIIERGIDNIETRICDACALPFAANTFEAISCRFGFMFFPDMLLTGKEMARVLKPGGRIAASIWNVPENNFWVTAIIGAIYRNLELPSPSTGLPAMFRYTKDRLISDLFLQAGLKHISVKEITGRVTCKTTGVYWNIMSVMDAPVIAALSKVDYTLKEKIKREFDQAVAQKYPEGNIQIDSDALIIYGEK